LRIRIDIDDELLSRAMAATKLRTRKATVELGLQLLLRQHQQVHALNALKGIGWFGDEDDHHPPPLDRDLK